MNFFEASVHWLHSLGFFTVLVPFLLIYAISFGLLERIKLFGKDSTNYNAVISFAFSFFTIYQLQLVEKMTLFITRIGLLFVLLLVTMIIAGLVGVHRSFAKSFVRIFIAGYLLFNIIDIFFGWNFSFINSEFFPMILGVLVTILVFFGVVLFVMREEKVISTKPNSSNSKKSSASTSQKKSSSPGETEESYDSMIKKELLEKNPSLSDEDLNYLVRINKENQRKRLEMAKKQIDEDLKGLG